MNLDTDIQFAFAESVGAKVMDKPVAFQHQVDPEDGTPYKKNSTIRANGCVPVNKA